MHMEPKQLEERIDRRDFLAVGGVILSGLGIAEGAEPELLPSGVKAVWDHDKAHREKTPTRERVCLNGLWRWQPGKELADAVPKERWGHFKVPGFWPGNTSYIQDDCQTLHAHPEWKNVQTRDIATAWHQREIIVPENWMGRRIALASDYVNSFAIVYLDDKKVGEIRFPGGEIDLTGKCRPGAKQTLSLLVIALPLKGVLLSYSDTNSAREVKGSVDRRGLCGDVWLSSTPAGARIMDVKVDTFTRKGEIAFDVAVESLVEKESYLLQFTILQQGIVQKRFKGKRFSLADITNGRMSHSEGWKPEKLWDIHTPQNMFILQVGLIKASDEAILDSYHPVRFGFREFRIDGRDFYLNDIRLQLSAVPLDNAQISARTASYEGAVETFRRLQSFGINFVYTHNYGCECGVEGSRTAPITHHSGPYSHGHHRLGPERTCSAQRTYHSLFVGHQGDGHWIERTCATHRTHDPRTRQHPDNRCRFEGACSSPVTHRTGPQRYAGYGCGFERTCTAPGAHQTEIPQHQGN